MEYQNFNWPAVIIGTITAFGLGMLWFSPLVFGKAWAKGSHNVQFPEFPPFAAMLVQLTGTFALALVVGLKASVDGLSTAILAIVSVTLLVSGMDMFSQKTTPAVLIDAGYIIAGGALMILAQALF